MHRPQRQVLFSAICSQCLIASVTSTSLRGLQATQSDMPMCMDYTAQTGNIKMRVCNEGESQRWVRDAGALKTQQDSKCLDYDVQADRVTMKRCDGGNPQRWFFQGQVLKNYQSTSCLDFSFQTGNVFMNDCNEGTNRIWLWQEEDTIRDCEWSDAHWNQYPRGAAYMPRYSFEAAKRVCTSQGDRCKAITCSQGGIADCVVATTSTLRSSGVAGRATYICTREGPKEVTIRAMPRTTTTTTTTVTTSTTTSSTTTTTPTTTNSTITTNTTRKITTTTTTTKTTTAGTISSTTTTLAQSSPVGSQQEAGTAIPIVPIVVATVGCCICCCLLVICLCRASGKKRVDLSGDAEPEAETNCSNVVVQQDVEFPSYWENQDMSNAFDKRYEQDDLIPVVQQLFDATWKDISTRDRKGTKPARLEVVSVQRMEDSQMWGAYVDQKKQIIERGELQSILELDGDLAKGHVLTDGFVEYLTQGGHLDQNLNEHFLFHGTSPQAAESIAEDGFRLTFAGSHVGTMFGNGAYFSECCSKADEYSTPGTGRRQSLGFRGFSQKQDEFAILLCRVCCGKMFRALRASDRTQFLPMLQEGSIDGVLGDREASVGTYREFVVFKEVQIYPEYRVLYRRGY